MPLIAIYGMWYNACMAILEIEIPDELWEALEDCARRERRSIDEIILEAITQYLAEHRDPDSGPGGHSEDGPNS